MIEFHSSIRIGQVDPQSPEVRNLLTQSDVYHAALYPAESNHLLDSEALQAKHIRCLGIFQGAELVGFGALVNQCDYGELKRMFVDPQFRGQALGAKLLQTLEEIAKEMRLCVMRLETGIYQPEAIRLYAKAGYTECPPFGTYEADDLSVFMEKDLS